MQQEHMLDTDYQVRFYLRPIDGKNAPFLFIKFPVKQTSDIGTQFSTHIDISLNDKLMIDDDSTKVIHITPYEPGDVSSITCAISNIVNSWNEYVSKVSIPPYAPFQPDLVMHNTNPHTTVNATPGVVSAEWLFNNIKTIVGDVSQNSKSPSSEDSVPVSDGVVMKIIAIPNPLEGSGGMKLALRVTDNDNSEFMLTIPFETPIKTMEHMQNHLKLIPNEACDETLPQAKVNDVITVTPTGVLSYQDLCQLIRCWNYQNWGDQNATALGFRNLLTKILADKTVTTNDAVASISDSYISTSSGRIIKVVGFLSTRKVIDDLPKDAVIACQYDPDMSASDKPTPPIENTPSNDRSTVPFSRIDIPIRRLNIPKFSKDEMKDTEVTQPEAKEPLRGFKVPIDVTLMTDNFIMHAGGPNGEIIFNWVEDQKSPGVYVKAWSEFMTPKEFAELYSVCVSGVLCTMQNRQAATMPIAEVIGIHLGLVISDLTRRQQSHVHTTPQIHKLVSRHIPTGETIVKSIATSKRQDRCSILVPYVRKESNGLKSKSTYITLTFMVSFPKPTVEQEVVTNVAMPNIKNKVIISNCGNNNNYNGMFLFHIRFGIYLQHLQISRDAIYREIMSGSCYTKAITTVVNRQLANLDNCEAVSAALKTEGVNIIISAVAVYLLSFQEYRTAETEINDVFCTYHRGVSKTINSTYCNNTEVPKFTISTHEENYGVEVTKGFVFQQNRLAEEEDNFPYPDTSVDTVILAEYDAKGLTIWVNGIELITIDANSEDVVKFKSIKCSRLDYYDMTHQWTNSVVGASLMEYIIKSNNDSVNFTSHTLNLVSIVVMAYLSKFTRENPITGDIINTVRTNLHSRYTKPTVSRMESRLSSTAVETQFYLQLGDEILRLKVDGVF